MSPAATPAGACLRLCSLIVGCLLVSAQSSPPSSPPGPSASAPPSNPPAGQSPPSAGDSSSPSASSSSYLFIQTADTSTIRLRDPKDISKGGRLIVRRVPLQTTWTTDFPNRQAGRISSKKFSMADDFWEARPTAALVGNLPHETGNGTLVVTILSLTDPIYIATDQTVMYNVSVLVSEGNTPSRPIPAGGGYELLDADGGMKLVSFKTGGQPVDMDSVTLYIYYDRCLQSLFEGRCRQDYAVTSGDTSFGPFSWGLGWSY